jgi:hypothetical protein
MRFSRAKPTGSFRVYYPKQRSVTAHADTLHEARKDAEFWSKQTPYSLEIQERFPSGAWVTVETVAPRFPMPSAARPKRAHATRHRKLPDRYEVVETIDGDWMILIDGIQTGSKRDRSGAGSDTHPTHEAAYDAALKMASGEAHATKRTKTSTSSSRAVTSKDLEKALLDRLGFAPDEDFILRAQSEWEGFSLDQLRAEEQKMTRQLDKSGGRGVDLADRIDSARTALALVDSGYLLKGTHGVLRAAQRKLPKAKLSFDY